MDLSEAKGAIITSVTPVEMGQADSGVKNRSCKPSDIIVEFQGTPVVNAQDLIQRVASTPVGQQVTLTYLRDTTNGKLEKKTATVALGERPPRESRVD